MAKVGVEGVTEADRKLALEALRALAPDFRAGLQRVRNAPGIAWLMYELIHELPTLEPAGQEKTIRTIEDLSRLMDSPNFRAVRDIPAPPETYISLRKLPSSFSSPDGTTLVEVSPAAGGFHTGRVSSSIMCLSIHNRGITSNAWVTRSDIAKWVTVGLNKEAIAAGIEAPAPDLDQMLQTVKSLRPTA